MSLVCDMSLLSFPYLLVKKQYGQEYDLNFTSSAAAIKYALSSSSSPSSSSSTSANVATAVAVAGGGGGGHTALDPQLSAAATAALASSSMERAFDLISTFPHLSLRCVTCCCC